MAKKKISSSAGLKGTLFGNFRRNRIAKRLKQAKNTDRSIGSGKHAGNSVKGKTVNPLTLFSEHMSLFYSKLAVSKTLGAKEVSDLFKEHMNVFRKFTGSGKISWGFFGNSLSKSREQKVSEGIKSAYENAGFGGDNSPRVVMECGRAITGPHGYLVSQVRHVTKKYLDFVGLDACMANLMRPGDRKSVV